MTGHARPSRGPDRCPTCDRRVLRYRTSGTTQTSTYEEVARGAWYIHPLTGEMRYCGHNALTDLDRFDLHTCLTACNPDETDQ